MRQVDNVRGNPWRVGCGHVDEGLLLVGHALVGLLVGDLLDRPLQGRGGEHGGRSVLLVRDGGGILLAVTGSMEGRRRQAREAKQAERDRNRHGDNAHPVGTAHESCCHCPRLDLVALMSSTVCPVGPPLLIGVSVATKWCLCCYSLAWPILYCVLPPIPHVIPSPILLDLKCDRWNSGVSGGLVKWECGELRAEFRGGAE